MLDWCPSSFSVVGPLKSITLNFSSVPSLGSVNCRAQAAAQCQTWGVCTARHKQQLSKEPAAVATRTLGCWPRSLHDADFELCAHCRLCQTQKKHICICGAHLFSVPCIMEWLKRNQRYSVQKCFYTRLPKSSRSLSTNAAGFTRPETGCALLHWLNRKLLCEGCRGFTMLSFSSGVSCVRK